MTASHWVMGRALCVVWVLAAAAAQAQTGREPLIESAVESPPATSYASEFPLTPADYDRLRDAEQTRIMVDLGSESRAELALVRFDVFDGESRIVIVENGLERPLPSPDAALFTGRIIGQPDTSAYLSISPYGVYGFILASDRQLVISSGPPGAGWATTLYDPAAVPPGYLNLLDFACATDTSDLSNWYSRENTDGAAGSSPCRYFRLAVETDYEFLANPFGGNSSAASAYVATLFGAVSQIYSRDVNTRVYVSFLRFWATPDDPWTAGSTSSQLDQFRTYWIENMGGEFRHLTHFLSGRALGGGVAYLNALCVFSIRYGLSANMAGYFPYPIQNNHPQNWDLMVVAHEIGHNFGAPHTHDMGIDYCAYGDCSVTPNGTIMSYCHLCSGGMANVRMEFHARTINEEMMPFIENEAPCNLVVVPPIFTVQPGSANPLCGATVVLHSEAVTLGPIVYRWRRNGIDLNDGPFVSGATTTTLTLTNVSEADSGNYVLSATSICEQTTTSEVAAVTPRCFLRGDCNCDGTIDNSDLDAFVLALINPLSFSIEYPQCDPLAADINGDGVVTNFDVDPFIHCLVTGACP